MDAPQGFEPRLGVPKTPVLPLDEGALVVRPRTYSAPHDTRLGEYRLTCPTLYPRNSFILVCVNFL